jgi:hypothetical protein
MRRLYGDPVDDPEWRTTWREQFPDPAAQYLQPE